MKLRSTLLAAPLLALSLAGAGQALYPDLSFGNCGRTLSPILPGGGESAVESFRQAGGKYLTIGNTGGQNNDFMVGLARYNTNGRHDSTFGTNGKMSVQFNFRNSARSATLQPDGKILICGTEAPSNAGSQHIPYVCRLHPDGSKDTAWGDGGRKAFRWDPVSSGEMFKAFPLGGGKTLALGTGRPNINGGGPSFGAARLDQNGDFDASFGTGGKIQVANAVGPGQAVASLPDSLYYMFVHNWNGSTYDLTAIRFKPDGIDSSFGTNGLKVIPNSALGLPDGNSSALYSTVQADGKILMVFFGDGPEWAWYVYRFHPNMTPDNAFGTAGKTVINTGTIMSGMRGEFGGMTLVSAGGANFIMLSGKRHGDGNPGISFRLTMNGQLDNTYGPQGLKVFPNPPFGGEQLFRGQFSDGNGLVFWGDGPGDRGDFLLARYGTLLPAASFAYSGDTICPGDTVRFSILDLACYVGLEWRRDGNNVGNTPEFQALEGGAYRLIVNWGYHRDTTVNLQVYKSPLTTPTLSQDRGLLTSSVRGTGFRYQWYRNATAIPGATNDSLLALTPGRYTLRIWDGSCTVLSTGLDVTVVSTRPLQSAGVSARWNARALALDLTGQAEGWHTAWLLSADGRRLPLQNLGAGRWRPTVPVAAGVYRLYLAGPDKSHRQQLLILE